MPCLLPLATMSWTALPAVALALYFGVGLVLFVLRSRRQGTFRDAEMADRGASVLLGSQIRHFFVWLMQPVLNALLWAEIPPDAITSVSVLLGIGAGISVAVDQFTLGGWFYLCAVMCDYFDGRIARQTGQTSASGAALDSVLDRYTEAAMIIGLAWHYRGEWVLLALLMFLSGSFLVPYMRAKGESLGMDMKVGLMQRPERVVILGIAVLLSPLADQFLPASATDAVSHPLAVVAIVLLTLSTQSTAAYRLWYITDRLDRQSGVTPPANSREVAIGNTIITLADLGIVVALVSQLGWPMWLATGGSCLLLTLVYFAWLRARGLHAGITARRAWLIAAGAALLNAGAVAVLGLLPDLDYRLVWLAARGLVSWAWNYRLTLPRAEANALPQSEPLSAETLSLREKVG